MEDVADTVLSGTWKTEQEDSHVYSGRKDTRMTVFGHSFCKPERKALLFSNSLELGSIVADLNDWKTYVMIFAGSSVKKSLSYLVL